MPKSISRLAVDKVIAIINRVLFIWLTQSVSSVIRTYFVRSIYMIHSTSNLSTIPGKQVQVSTETLSRTVTMHVCVYVSVTIRNT